VKNPGIWLCQQIFVQLRSEVCSPGSTLSRIFAVLSR
jgi:hypothetical protein